MTLIFTYEPAQTKTNVAFDVQVNNQPYYGRAAPATYTRKSVNCDSNCKTANATEVVKTSMCCTPDRQKIRRSASTYVSKTYYTSSSQYLRARCKQYEQNLTRPETFSCSENPDCHTPTYKRSNAVFGANGAVPSSLRTYREKYNAVETTAKYNPNRIRYRGDIGYNVNIRNYAQPVCTKRTNGYCQ